MPHRDPQTGQFLAETERGDSWEGFDKQSLRMVYEISSTAATGPNVAEDWFVTEPSGGLRRNQLAELVALLVKVSGRVFTQSNPLFHGHVVRELTTRADSQYLETEDRQRETDVVSGINRETWEEEEDPDLIDLVTVNSEHRQDASNGLAAFDAAGPLEYAVPFRGMFGQGPVYDRHTDLHWHILFNIAAGSSAGATINEEVTLVWDVFEEE